MYVHVYIYIDIRLKKKFHGPFACKENTGK